MASEPAINAGNLTGNSYLVVVVIKARRQGFDET